MLHASLCRSRRDTDGWDGSLAGSCPRWASLRGGVVKIMSHPRGHASHRDRFRGESRRHERLYRHRLRTWSKAIPILAVEFFTRQNTEVVGAVVLKQDLRYDLALV